MGQYLAKRLVLFIPTVLLVSLMVFLVMNIIPGDPAMMILMGEQGERDFSEQEVNDLRHKLGTDRSLPVQYATWLGDMVRGDFGISMFYDEPVWDELKERFPTTLELIFIAFVISFGLAVPLGVMSAVKQDTGLDYAGRLLSISGIALPTFWLGIMVIFFLVEFFNWVPPLGYATLWDDPLKNLSQMIFPAAVLGFYNMAFIARVTRSSMLDVMREDYIRTARSKGLWELTVIWRHALRNAIAPVLTISGWQMGRLIGGTVIIESIFLVPGVGRTLIDAIFHRDFTMVSAVIFLVAFGVLLLNLIIDMLYAWLDPRIRYA